MIHSDERDRLWPRFPDITTLRHAWHYNMGGLRVDLADVNMAQRPIVKSVRLEIIHTARGICVVPRGAC